MNDVLNTGYLDLNALLDEQYSLSNLRASVISHNKELDTVADKIRKTLSSAFGNVDTEEDIHYAVVMNDSIKDGLADGTIKLDTSKEGKVFAQIRRNGKYGEKLEIQEELKNEGLTELQIQTFMQNQMIAEALLTVLDTLQDIQEAIADVKHGQINDRVGLYYSGLNLYVESKMIKNEELKQLILAQSLKALNDSISQMTQSFRDAIQYLLDKRYEDQKKKRARLIEEKMSEINYYFNMIYKAQVLKSFVYFDNNEAEAALLCYSEYGRLIENMVIPNEALLREYDKNDIYLKDGVWEKRAKSLLKVNSIISLPRNNTVYYIGRKELYNGEER